MIHNGKKAKKLKPAFRHDTRPAPSGYVTPEEASRRLLGEDQGEGAEGARAKMLARMGLNPERDGSAAARDRMIQRHQGKKQ